MSARELRAAATLIRETASNATPGPWERDGIGDYGWTVRDTDPAGTFAIETEDSVQGQADAAWIALMSPAVAEHLAAVLEEAAELYEWSLERCHADLRDQLEPRVRAQVEHELDLARSILGRTS